MLEELGGGLDGVDNLGLNVQTVGLRDSEDGRGAGVALRRARVSKVVTEKIVPDPRLVEENGVLTSLVKTFPKDDIFAIYPSLKRLGICFGELQITQCWPVWRGYRKIFRPAAFWVPGCNWLLSGPPKRYRVWLADGGSGGSFSHIGVGESPAL